jgi:hypothetical protein
MVSGAGDGDTVREPPPHPVALECVECGMRSTCARGWRAFRVDLPDDDEEPVLTFYCPDCWAREFG